jgi:hypothetical protein
MLIGLHRRPRGFGTIADTIASAIYRQEGAVQNNNPGNLMYAGQPGAIGADSRGFAIFSTLQLGQTAEVNQINLDITRGTCATSAPVTDLSDLITCLSPPSQNDTATYISNVSAWTGIDPTANLQALSTGITSTPIPTVLSTSDETAVSDSDASDYTWLVVLGVGLAMLYAIEA